ncbi:DUF2141 domain-containing protein [Teredinibacter sp. KSP-S5-2]|uniref:DUF2141 domain-containing protein n=1 Tax=Teredinibacter sp. KSP-S5-2 TaxID=3034506 RepID=UPI002934ADD7|nr:DUF2141 domain-containing protein [Teredinibacter sp. KSP-S5-2]WNO09227.1 DUF2141 domain-containing protein [Teredinibacter sp. KSP-S5-2]
MTINRCNLLHKCGFYQALAVLMVCLFSLSTQAEAVRLSLTIDGNYFPNHTLYLALYRIETEHPMSWQDEPSLQKKLIMKEQEKGEYFLEDIPPGRYAIKGYIDLNQNQVLDKTVKDRPKEPFGVSLGENKTKPSLNIQQSIFEVSTEKNSAVFVLRTPKAAYKLANTARPDAI